MDAPFPPGMLENVAAFLEQAKDLPGGVGEGHDFSLWNGQEPVPDSQRSDRNDVGMVKNYGSSSADHFQPCPSSWMV